MTNTPKLTLEEAQAVVETKTAPRVTLGSIERKIANVDYFEMRKGTEGDSHGAGVLCIITMQNGWSSTGFSAPASPENFDFEVGKRYAYENAFKPLWQLEGYLLREELHWRNSAPVAPQETVAA